MSLEETLKDELNPEQYRAVTTTEGAILRTNQLIADLDAYGLDR